MVGYCWISLLKGQRGLTLNPDVFGKIATDLGADIKKSTEDLVPKGTSVSACALVNRGGVGGC